MLSTEMFFGGNEKGRESCLWSASTVSSRFWSWTGTGIQWKILKEKKMYFKELYVSVYEAEIFNLVIPLDLTDK